MSSSSLLNNTHTVVLPKWIPHPLLTDTKLLAMQKYVDAIPLIEQQPPIDGEVFARLQDAFDRLQNYAACAGFLVVTSSGGELKGRVRYACVHGGMLSLIANFGSLLTPSQVSCATLASSSRRTVIEEPPLRKQDVLGRLPLD